MTSEALKPQRCMDYHLYIKNTEQDNLGDRQVMLMLACTSVSLYSLNNHLRSYDVC
jgi:hypothetical protein